MEMLKEKLFPDVEVEPIIARKIPTRSASPLSTKTANAVFVHDEMLSAAHPLLKNSLPKIFVFDEYLHGNGH